MEFFVSNPVPVLIAIGLVGMIVIIQVRRARRREAIAEIAREHGMRFEPTVPETAIAGLVPSMYRRLQTAENYLEGKIGWTEVDVVDLVVSVRSGSQNSSRRTTTVGAVAYTGPEFRIVPGNPRDIATKEKAVENFAAVTEKMPFLGAMMDRAGVPVPLSIDGSEEFTSGCMVYGDDEDQTQAALTPAIQSFCIEHRDYTVESTGTHLLLYRQSVNLPADAYPTLLDDLKALDRAAKA